MKTEEGAPDAALVKELLRKKEHLVEMAIKKFTDSIRSAVGLDADGGVKVEAQANIKTEPDGSIDVEAAVREFLGDMKHETKDDSAKIKVET